MISQDRRHLQPIAESNDDRSTRSGAKRILFVDDQPELLSGLRRLFHSIEADWEMRFASGGTQALQILEEWPAQVIVSDMCMPGMDGAELLTEVMRRHPGTVRIMLSGQAENEAILRSVKSVHQYLAKPCPPEHLKAVIAQVFSFHDRLNDPELTRFISTLTTLPSVPRIYTRLLEELRAPSSTISTVADLISQDAAMSCRLLQIVNSSFFGLPRRAESPAHAARLLGLERLRPLVLSAGVFSQYDGISAHGLTVDAIMAHSLAAAAFAKKLVEVECPGQVGMAQDAVLACIVHDIGQLILMQNCRQDYDRLLAQAQQGEGLLHELEVIRLKVSHAALGGHLLHLWGLPDVVAEAVAFHHTPSESHQRTFGVLAAVHIATALDHEQRALDSRLWTSPLDMLFLRQLGLEDKLPLWREATAI